MNNCGLNCGIQRDCFNSSHPNIRMHNYSPNCSLNIFYDADMFNNQELLQSMISSFILLTLMSDSGGIW